MINRAKKYRAFDTEDKIMWQPLTLEEILAAGWELNSVKDDWSLPQSDYMTFAHTVTVWMEFTGVKDTDGKDCYESDVVEVSYGRGRVIFSMGCFMIEWIDDPECNMELLGISHFKRGTPRKFKILGNGYENPELLVRIDPFKA